MDITDRGPLLNVGRFAMRVTNIGVLGNAFYDKGLSFDPSFEYPRGSGHELLNHAELWVGARNANGELRVSGGPMLEWRPTLDPSDRVRILNAGDPGTRSHVDDDGDGRVDEELLNGRDDDGDGLIDEDVYFPSQQMLTAEYTDDQPEAVNYAYPNGEQHVPLGLAVHQENYAWSAPGHDGIAGVKFTVTNKGAGQLRDVRLGLYADLDSRERNAGAGYLNNELSFVRYSVDLNAHSDTLAGNWVKQCIETVSGEAAVVRDAVHATQRPGVALVPLTHTTDPLGFLINDAFPGVRDARAAARAPRRDSTFKMYPYSPGAPPGQGGPPLVDADRYAALAGNYPTASTDQPGDYAVLLSCGPFSHLDPGQSLEFVVALVALPNPDSAAAMAFEAKMLYRGTRLDLQPNTGGRGNYSAGNTGWNGHEICLEPPPGVEFNYDPHCPEKFRDDKALVPIQAQIPPTTAVEVHYKAGTCIWTDLDCDICTGDDGVDTIRPWELDLRLAPSPATHATAGDHGVHVAWDNAPEQDINAGSVGGGDFRFAGYKLYRLDSWSRESLLPEPDRWQRLAVYHADSTLGGESLSAITDLSVAPDGSNAGGPHYPVGRYRVDDPNALNGFDYHYLVTTILRGHPGGETSLPAVEYESPFAASFNDKVVPHAAARATSGAVWVVPNPYRGSA